MITRDSSGRAAGPSCQPDVLKQLMSQYGNQQGCQSSSRQDPGGQCQAIQATQVFLNQTILVLSPKRDDSASVRLTKIIYVETAKEGLSPEELAPAKFSLLYPVFKNPLIEGSSDKLLMALT